MYELKNSPMKNTWITASAMLFAMTACAQKIARKDVPEALRSTLQGKYPAAQVISWEKEDTNYEAVFELRDSQMSVLMDPAGNILETETEIDPGRLPESVVAYVELNYSGQRIRGAAKITYADGTVNYEAELKGKDLIFDVCGVFIQEITA
jgi:hypothetical protein